MSGDVCTCLFGQGHPGHDPGCPRHGTPTVVRYPGTQPPGGDSERTGAARAARDDRAHRDDDDEHRHDGRADTDDPKRGAEPGRLRGVDTERRVDRRGGGRPPWTLALSLTTHPSGPTLSLTGPAEDGTYTLSLTPATGAQGWNRYAAQRLDREHLVTQLAHLIVRLDLDAAGVQ